MPSPHAHDALWGAARHSLAPRWAPWQPEPGKPFALDAIDPSAKPFSTGSKAEDKAAVEALAVELDALQNLFYADKRYKLLVVLRKQAALAA